MKFLRSFQLGSDGSSGDDNSALKKKLQETERKLEVSQKEVKDLEVKLFERSNVVSRILSRCLF